MGPGANCRRSAISPSPICATAYAEQVRGLLDGGVDLLIVETCQDLLQTKAALAAIFAHFEKHRVRVPVIAQVTIEVFGTMLNGTEIGAALTALAPFPIDVIGMNCGTGPRHMTESIRYLCENAPLPVSVLPNAGLPSVVEGKMHYDETPETFTAQVVHFANDFGVNIVGGCCGTTPAHLKFVVEAMQRITPKARDAKLVPAASSIYFQQPYVQDASFLIVGERVNASGSKKMRDLLNAEDWDGLVALGKGAGTRRRAHPRRERRLRRPQRRERHARTRFAAGHEHQDAADVRLDRVGEDGSRPAARRRQVHSQFDQLRRRRAALCESDRSGEDATAPASSSERSTKREWRAPLKASSRSRSALTNRRPSEFGLPASRHLLRSAGAADLDRHRRGPPQRARDHRRNPPNQGRAAGLLSRSSAFRTSRSVSIRRRAWC